MHGVSKIGLHRATKSPAEFCRDPSEPEPVGKILPRNWSFSFLCSRLWPAPLVAAKQVEFLTGASDRTCRAWCSGQSEPPSWVLVAILASDDGARALAIVMGEFGPAWHRDLAVAAEIMRRLAGQ